MTETQADGAALVALGFFTALCLFGLGVIAYVGW